MGSQVIIKVRPYADFTHKMRYFIQGRFGLLVHTRIHIHLFWSGVVAFFWWVIREL